MNHGISIVLIGVFILLGLTGCEKLPGQKEPFQLGPLHFGMTVAEMKTTFTEQETELDAYDTPRGQTWTVVDPFGDDVPQPLWLTEDVERVALSFWGDRLYRVRLHFGITALVDLLDFKKKFSHGYQFEVDQSQGELLFLEFSAPDMKIFLRGGGSESGSVAFVDLPAYRALDVARRRWKQKAAESFELEGLKFGMGLGSAEDALGQMLSPSDFYQGLESRYWLDEENGREWELGFAADLGLSAIAIIYQKRWPPVQVREKLFSLTKQYGQGQMKYSPKSYSMIIDAQMIRVTLIVMDCREEGCMVSEGWLWTGPAETE